MTTLVLWFVFWLSAKTYKASCPFRLASHAPGNRLGIQQGTRTWHRVLESGRRENGIGNSRSETRREAV